jgi:hypothetical protein
VAHPALLPEDLAVEAPEDLVEQLAEDLAVLKVMKVMAPPPQASWPCALPEQHGT